MAPQGGIGSPFLWSAVLNELIKLIKNIQGIRIIAYADDLCLLASGPVKDDCIKLPSIAMYSTVQWSVALQ